MYINYGSFGTNPDLRLCAGGTSNQRVVVFLKASNGFCSIGGAQPTEMLHVSGNILCSDTLNIQSIEGEKAVILKKII